MENKLVTYKNLKIGQEIKGHEDGGSSSSYTGYIKSINPAFVTVAQWKKDGKEEKINSSCMFKELLHLMVKSSVAQNKTNRDTIQLDFLQRACKVA